MKRTLLIGLVLVVFELVPGLSLFGQDKPKPEKPKSQVEMGIEYYKAGKYPETIAVLKEVIRTSIDPHDLMQSYIYLAYTYFSLQEMENANAQVEKAVEMNLDYALSEDEFVPDFIAFYKKVKNAMTGTGYFESSPPQASITVDDNAIGLTPLKKDLLAKIYRIRAVKSGYTPYEAEVEIKKTEVANVKIPLDKDHNWKTFIRSSVVFVVMTFLLKSI